MINDEIFIQQDAVHRAKLTRERALWLMHHLYHHISHIHSIPNLAPENDKRFIYQIRNEYPSSIIN